MPTRFRMRRRSLAQAAAVLAGAVLCATLAASGSTAGVVASPDEPGRSGTPEVYSGDAHLRAALQSPMNTAQRLALKQQYADARPSATAPEGSEARQAAWAAASHVMEMSARGGVVTAALPRTASATALEAAKKSFQMTGARSTIAVKRSVLTKAELDATTVRLSDLYNAHARRGEGMTFYYDAAEDAVIVTGNLSPSLTAQMKALRGVRVESSPSVRVSNNSGDRYNDSGPWHFGAASITNQTTANNCTSGFTMQDGPQNNYASYTVTAGHCGSAGNSFKSGGIWYGTITNKPAYPNWDAAKIQCCGDQYGKQIYTNRYSTRNQITAWNPGPGRPAPSGVCVSGRAGYAEKCNGNISSINATFCVAQYVCTYDLIQYETPNTGEAMTSPGDSGAPVYSLNAAGEAQI
ncbi:MAG: hypothetical protein QOJ24_1443, partial [Mycobacterium sp.]|nr:hypothetical protein [Mycobacterium sp.]